MDGIEYMMENSKLVSFSNGLVELHEKVLGSFVKQINPSLSSLPVAILSIIGPPRSGKSFYSNLLIKYLENRSEDWLTEFSSSDTIQKDSLQGFAFDDVTLHNIVPTTADSGIYIWPNPLIIRNYRGKILVCILHFHECKGKSNGDEAVYILNILLRLLCSRITEIRWSFNNFAGLDFDMDDSTPCTSTIPKMMVCRSFVNLYRAQRHLLESLMEKTAISPLNVDKSKNSVANFETVLNSSNIVYIEESLESLHDVFGKLKLTASMHSQVDNAIKFIADGNKIFPKLDQNGSELTTSAIQRYFSFGVLIVNEYIKCRAQQFLTEPLIKVEPEKVEQEMASLRSEQKRREEEENCAKFVENALAELEHQLKDQLDCWLKQTLSIDTVDECQQMYENCLQKTLDNMMSTDLSVENFKKVKQMLLERSKGAKEKLERIHTVVTAFHSHVYDVMKKNCCLDSESMAQELLRSIEDEDAYVMKCEQLGCSRLASIYISQNESIAAYEMKLLLRACQHIRKRYNEKLGDAIGLYYYSPKQIREFHSSLKNFCIEKVRSTFRITKNAASTFTFIAIETEKQLNKQLAKDYETYKLLNLKKLKHLHAKTMEIISKHKASYCFQMENILKESPNGVPGGAFETQHLTISKDVITDMKKEIRQSITQLEPLQGSVNIFINHINLFWVNFNRLNGEQLDQSKSDSNKSSHLQENNYSKNTQQVDPLSVPYNGKSSTEIVSQHAVYTEKKTALSPIIFKLSLSQIGTYIQYKNELQTFGVHPTAVSATVDGLLVLGDENESDKVTWDKKWKLADYLIASEKSDTQEHLKIGDASYPINSVLLLGFIMHSLKQKVEKKCHGFVTECVVTIPFWLTSRQRQDIKDSGQSAGFHVTHLINENSVAALHFCHSNFDEGTNDIVVLSENSGVADVTIYSYDKFYQVVKITGCAGFYDYKGLSESKAPGKITELVDKVKEFYKIAQKMSDAKLKYYNRSKEKTAVVSTESDVWKAVFATVGKGIISKNSKVEGLNEPLVVNGAFTYSENPSKKRKTMKDWLSTSIFRKTGNQKEIMVQQRKDCLLLAPQERHFVNDYFDLRDNEVIYFQKDVKGQEVEIGRLKWKSPSTFWANIYFEVSEEAIVSLNPKHPSTSNGILWTPHSLEEYQPTVYLSLFESFDLIRKQIEERDRKKQDLIEQGTILLQRIENAAFRSTLAKEMALSQIKESLELLKHPKITAKEIEKQLENFQKYETKLGSK